MYHDTLCLCQHQRRGFVWFGSWNSGSLFHRRPTTVSHLLCDLPDEVWRNRFRTTAFLIFMDTGGVIIGVAAEAPELLTPSGDVVNAKRAWIVLALGMIVASLTGTSPPVM
ncbi:MAG: hypothetical protein KVP17_001983 [Porospora cf. gigantea B]|uniref:uncharacterized protein n=1 Tax=Porospora cf. gigantea B TaxID=2853592 RepID=UPI003571EFC7|nr:MAG: hypothetical protein KVP17_001983 [Porospora cf. gigantea B]